MLVLQHSKGEEPLPLHCTDLHSTKGGGGGRLHVSISERDKANYMYNVCSTMYMLMLRLSTPVYQGETSFALYKP